MIIPVDRCRLEARALLVPDREPDIAVTRPEERFDSEAWAAKTISALANTFFSFIDPTPRKPRAQ